jgi:hypothetical protein
MGQQLTPEDQVNLVRGRLCENVVLGTDAGVQSAKQLGADKRVSMWQPDSQTGLIVLKAPEMPKFNPKIPVKWLPPLHAEDDEAEGSSSTAGSGRRNLEAGSGKNKDVGK